MIAAQNRLNKPIGAIYKGRGGWTDIDEVARRSRRIEIPKVLG